MRELNVNALQTAKGNAYSKDEFSWVANVGIKFAIGVEKSLGLEGVRIGIHALIVRHGPAEVCK